MQRQDNKMIHREIEATHHHLINRIIHQLSTEYLLRKLALALSTKTWIRIENPTMKLLQPKD